MLDREHLAGAAEAGLDLVGDQQQAALLAELVEAVPPLHRRRQATDRLDDLGDHGAGLRPGVELSVDAVETLDRAGRGRAELAAVAVRVRDLERVGAQRPARALAVLLAGGDLERADGEAVVGVVEVGDVGLAGGLARHLERELVGLGAAGREERLIDRARQQPDQPLGQADHRHGAVLARHLQHLVELLGRGLDDARVAVAGVVDEVAGGEVEVVLAVDVGDDAAAGLGDDDRLARRMGPRPHDVLLVIGDQGVGLGLGERRNGRNGMTGHGLRLVVVGVRHGAHGRRTARHGLPRAGRSRSRATAGGVSRPPNRCQFQYVRAGHGTAAGGVKSANSLRRRGGPPAGSSRGRVARIRRATTIMRRGPVAAVGPEPARVSHLRRAARGERHHARTLCERGARPGDAARRSDHRRRSR